MKNTFVISCPIDTYSGYGARSRDVVKSIIKSDKYDVKILPQRWGNTPWGFIEDHEDWPEFSKVRGSDRDNMEDFIERIGYERIWQQEVEVYKNCFLTETAAKQHLQSNRHHYGPKAATYVHHFWRNPEVEKLFEAVGRMTGVPYELQYKREREDDKS